MGITWWDCKDPQMYSSQYSEQDFLLVIIPIFNISNSNFNVFRFILTSVSNLFNILRCRTLINFVTFSFILHCEKYCNLTWFPGVEILRKGAVSHSFGRIAKFPHQEYRFNYGIFRSVRFSASYYLQM